MKGKKQTKNTDIIEEEELKMEIKEPEPEPEPEAEAEAEEEEVEISKTKPKRELTEKQKQHLDNIRQKAIEKKQLLALHNPNSNINKLKAKEQKHKEILSNAPLYVMEEPKKKEELSQAKTLHEEDVVVKNASYYKNKYKMLKQQHQELTNKTLEKVQRNQEKEDSYEDKLIQLKLQEERKKYYAKMMGITIGE